MVNDPGCQTMLNRVDSQVNNFGLKVGIEIILNHAVIYE